MELGSWWSEPRYLGAEKFVTTKRTPRSVNSDSPFVTRTESRLREVNVVGLGCRHGFTCIEPTVEDMLASQEILILQIPLVKVSYLLHHRFA